jgi:hypothetical protein
MKVKKLILSCTMILALLGTSALAVQNTNGNKGKKAKATKNEKPEKANKNKKSKGGKKNSNAM